MSESIQVTGGPRYPVDQRFQPVSGYDENGYPKPLTLEGGALKTTPAAGSVASTVGLDSSAFETFTRPANTTAYAARDAVGQTDDVVLLFTGLARVNGGAGYVTDVTITATGSLAGVTLRLHLFSGQPNATIDGLTDNANLNMGALDGTYLGYVDVPMTNTGAGSSHGQSSGAPKRFKCASGSPDIYGVLETLSAYTPSSAGVYTVTVAALQS